MGFKDCLKGCLKPLKPILKFVALVSAIWMIGDMVLDGITTSKYYELSPYFNPNHEANLNMSTRVMTFCSELDKVEFDQSMLNETQRNFHDEWKERCKNKDVDFLDSLNFQKQNESSKVSMHNIT